MKDKYSKRNNSSDKKKKEYEINLNNNLSTPLIDQKQNLIDIYEKILKSFNIDYKSILENKSISSIHNHNKFNIDRGCQTAIDRKDLIITQYNSTEHSQISSIKDSNTDYEASFSGKF